MSQSSHDDDDDTTTSAQPVRKRIRKIVPSLADDDDSGGAKPVSEPRRRTKPAAVASDSSVPKPDDVVASRRRDGGVIDRPMGRGIAVVPDLAMRLVLPIPRVFHCFVHLATCFTADKSSDTTIAFEVTRSSQDDFEGLSFNYLSGDHVLLLWGRIEGAECYVLDESGIFQFCVSGGTFRELAKDMGVQHPRIEIASVVGTNRITMSSHKSTVVESRVEITTKEAPQYVELAAMCEHLKTQRLLYKFNADVELLKDMAGKAKIVDATTIQIDIFEPLAQFEARNPTAMPDSSHFFVKLTVAGPTGDSYFRILHAISLGGEQAEQSEEDSAYLQEKKQSLLESLEGSLKHAYRQNYSIECFRKLLSGFMPRCRAQISTGTTLPYTPNQPAPTERVQFYCPLMPATEGTAYIYAIMSSVVEQDGEEPFVPHTVRASTITGNALL